MKNSAAASLLEPKSVSARLLGACSDWDLKYRDNASAEYQYALDNGLAVGEASGYKGTGCFVDNLIFSGLDIFRGPSGQPFVFPRPDNSDQQAHRFLEIASTAGLVHDPNYLIALGCLSDRYDLKILAAYYMTLGLNLNKKPTPYQEIKTCLSSQFAGHYKFAPSPGTARGRSGNEFDIYFPNDFAQRVPSPTQFSAPPRACWVTFPVDRDCVP
jgi:hypothetical protein